MDARKESRTELYGRWRSAVVFLLLLPAAPTVRAESGTLTIVDGFYTNAGSNYVLGNTGPGNVLILTNAGWQEDATATIGYAPSAASNTAIVTGPGSLWRNTARLNLGYGGPNNLLVITNQARVTASSTYVGYETTSTNNTILLAGAGSHWEPGELQFGYGGSGNRLFITGGGVLVGGFFGSVGYNAPSANNLAVIEGFGSAWAGNYYLEVGAYGSSGNQLRISGAGQAISAFGTIGSGDHNSVLLTDSGSLWQISEVLYIGYEGTDNLLTITNGARALCVSAVLNGTSNRLVVTGPGSLLSTSLSRGQVVVGSSGVNNQLLVLAGGNVSCRAGYVFGLNQASVIGTGALWQNSELLQIGEDFDPNVQLRISAGGRVAAPTTVLAGDTSRIEISGFGSLLDNSGVFTLGSELGISNQLLIADGGVLSTGSGYIGGRDSAFFNGRNNYNTTLLTGAGSAWRSTNDLVVGVTGSFNLLTVTNAAQVQCRTGFVGYFGYSGNNTVLLAGTNSLWNNRSDLFIGYAGNDNRLVVSNGAQVFSANGTVGRQNSRNNSVLVTGPGSGWQANGSLLIGASAFGNTLAIVNGARVTSASGLVGDLPLGVIGAVSNQVSITGSGSLWSISGSFGLGLSSSLNSLAITSGGTLQAAGVQVGGTVNSFSNSVVVAGGNLIVTNVAGSSVLQVNRASLQLNGGSILADRVIANQGAPSIFTFAGGSIRTRGATIANGQQFSVGTIGSASQLVLQRGVHRFADGLVVPVGATLEAAGTLDAAVTNAGTFNVGATTDSLIITHDAHLDASSQVTFELGGPPQSGQYDFIQVSNSVRLGGALHLKLSPNFLPASNAVFTIMRFRTAAGGFVNAPSGSRIAVDGSPVTCRVAFTPTSLSLSDFYNAAPATSLVDDTWALRYFGHAPLTEEELFGDSDGDGLSNYAEYIAGTNPLDPASVLQAALFRIQGPGHTRLQFQCVAGKTYQISFSSNLTEWVEVMGATLSTPQPGFCEWVDDGRQTGGLPATVTSRFYRVSVR